MQMSTDRDWLRKMAELEDGCDVSVGSQESVHRYLNIPSEMLYIQTLGRFYSVTAVAVGIAAANAYMESKPGEGLLLEFGSFCFMAKLDDKGVKA